MRCSPYGNWSSVTCSQEDLPRRLSLRMIDILERIASVPLVHLQSDVRLQHRNLGFADQVEQDKSAGSHREDVRDSERKDGCFGCNKAVHSDSWPWSAHTHTVKRRAEELAMLVREISAGFWCGCPAHVRAIRAGAGQDRIQPHTSSVNTLTV